MSRYIEFTTSPGNSHTKFSLGNPVHDGEMPSKFRDVLGIRVDGGLAAFADEAIADELHRTLLEGRQMERTGIPFNCVTFAAAMRGISLENARHNPFRKTRKEVAVEPDDALVDAPVNLGVGSGQAVRYRHTILPAHTTEAAQYIHKLGDAGPICISGLGAALRMFDCDVAHEVILD